MVQKIIGNDFSSVICDEHGSVVYGERFKMQQKFAPVGPARLYEAFVTCGYVPDTVLLLAHEVVKDAITYERVFKAPELLNTNIIMDNSLVELGNAVDLNMVQEACDIVSADIAVLPDVMGDGKLTFEATFDAYDSWKANLEDVQLMALIHGRNFEEWLWCAHSLATKCSTPWIGVPRITQGLKDIRTGQVYSRSTLVKLVSEVFYPGTPIHLFGFSDNPMEDMMAAAHPDVKSIDSAVPLRLDGRSIFHPVEARNRRWFDEVEFRPNMIKACKEMDSIINSLTPA